MNLLNILLIETNIAAKQVATSYLSTKAELLITPSDYETGHELFLATASKVVIVDCLYPQSGLNLNQDATKSAKECFDRELREGHKKAIQRSFYGHRISFLESLDAMSEFEEAARVSDSPLGLNIAASSQILGIPCVLTMDRRQSRLNNIIEEYCGIMNYPLVATQSMAKDGKLKPEFWERVYDDLLQQIQAKGGQK